MLTIEHAGDKQRAMGVVLDGKAYPAAALPHAALVEAKRFAFAAGADGAR